MVKKFLFFILSLFLLIGCVPVGMQSENLPEQDFTPSVQQEDTNFPASTEVMEQRVLSFDVVQNSQTRLGILPVNCFEGELNNCEIEIRDEILQENMAGPFQWNTTGESIAFISNMSGKFNLAWIDLMLSDPVTSTTGSQQREDCPTWSPDGKKILFIRDDVINNSPGSALWLLDENKQEIKLADFASCASWSGEGNKIVYTAYNTAVSESELVILKLTQSEIIDSISLSINVDSLLNASFSPSEDLIVFEGVIQQRNSIYTIFPDGSGYKELTPTMDDATNPLWSPTGEWLVFSSNTTHISPAELYLVNAEGTSLINLTNTPNIDENAPVWSPDGKWLAYSSLGESGFSDIYIIQSDGSGLKKITNANIECEYLYPAWQP